MGDPFFSVSRDAQAHIAARKLYSQPFPFLGVRLVFLESRKFWISWQVTTAGNCPSWFLMTFSDKSVAELWTQILPLFPDTVWFTCPIPWMPPPPTEHPFPAVTDPLPRSFGKQPSLAASHAAASPHHLEGLRDPAQHPQGVSGTEVWRRAALQCLMTPLTCLPWLL